MSQNKYSIVLTFQAQSDFEDILQYTLETWGEDQFHKYANVLNSAMDVIISHPKIGSLKKKILKDIRFHYVEKHIICYKIKKNNIFIVRILHNRMDVSKHLKNFV